MSPQNEIKSTVTRNLSDISEVHKALQNNTGHVASDLKPQAFRSTKPGDWIELFCRNCGCLCGHMIKQEDRAWKLLHLNKRCARESR